MAGEEDYLEPQPPRSPEERILQGDPTTAEAKEQAEQTKQHQERALGMQEFLKGLLANEFGRAWLHDHLHSFGTWQAPFAVGMDSRATDHLNGRRSAGWEIWEQIDEIDPIRASMLRRGK